MQTQKHTPVFPWTNLLPPKKGSFSDNSPQNPFTVLIPFRKRPGPPKTKAGQATLGRILKSLPGTPVEIAGRVKRDKSGVMDWLQYLLETDQIYHGGWKQGKHGGVWQKEYWKGPRPEGFRSPRKPAKKTDAQRSKAWRRRMAKERPDDYADFLERERLRMAKTYNKRRVGKGKPDPLSIMFRPVEAI